MAMLLGLVGSAAAASDKVELVLAVKEGDKCDWAHEYATQARVTAYNKAQQPLNVDAVTEVALPNVGREAHVYLHHIVHRFDSLAEKTVFMPGGLPTAGFHGFAQSGASLLPGATLKDYLAPDTEELMIPTMALSPDLKQFSVRMSLMDNKTEPGLQGNQRFSVCSADGAAGWSPFLPNKFSSSVLEPLMTQQHARWDFGSFWSRYMGGMPLPEHVLAAHGAVFSVSRETVRSRPKAFYEALLAELEGSKDPYQAFFLEHMWWYIFHGAQAAPCEADLATPESRKSASRSLASNRRKLYTVYTVLEPHAGQQVAFGSTINIAWSVSNDGFHRVELWRYGSFVTRLYDSMHGHANVIKSINWHVEPGPVEDSSDNNTGTKSYHALRADTGPEKTWYRFVQNFHPGDKYTVRVCAYSDNPYEQICDNVFGESGEFKILSTVTMLSPVQQNTYKPGDVVPITWQTYHATGHTVLLYIRHEGRIVWCADSGVTAPAICKPELEDDGVFTFYTTQDMGPGIYEVTVLAGPSTARVEAKTAFTMLPGPPSPPPPPRAPPLPKTTDWEVPIIQAFKGSFGLDEIKYGPGPQGTTEPYTATVPGGLNCEYVCHVATTGGFNSVSGQTSYASPPPGALPPGQFTGRRARRLLFGGLQYYSGVDQNIGVGCSSDMKLCNCKGC